MMRCDVSLVWRWLWTTRWPWIALAAGPIFMISPFGQSLLHSAFYSGEQLARSLSQFMLMMVALVWAGLVLLEWLVRIFMLRRRAKRLGATPAQTE
jgi:hypothetical protein